MLDNAVTFLKSIPQPTRKDKPYYNIGLQEREALNALIGNDKIIIIEADKGSSVVIMDALYYRDKIKIILNDDKAYENIHINNDKVAMQKIMKITEKYIFLLTANKIKYLTSFESHTSQFYGMPKVHKCKSVIDAIHGQQSTVHC